MPPIYLDHSATTPLRPEVLEAMLPYLKDSFGNPGSIHAFGRAARRAVDDAREQVAALINAQPREIVFTSGGTEADNLAIFGVMAAAHGTKRVITTSIEHHAVLHAAERAVTSWGAELAVVNSDDSGCVPQEAVIGALNSRTALVSMMHANNETGVLQPVQAVAEACAEQGILFHTDAVQSCGKVPFDVRRTPVALLALSAHKVYGPKGAGACYVRKDTDLAAQLVGGNQERELRSGTENVAGIVGLGAACALAQAEMAETSARVERLRDRLQAGLLARVPGTWVNGGPALRLPHILNAGFENVEGESIVLSLDMEAIAVSSGSACTSGSLDPSHVILAMGQPRERAQSAVRFSLGRDTTEAEIDRVLDVIPRVIERLRATEPQTGANRR